MASVRTEWPSLKGDCTPNRAIRVRDLPNGQNKRPFPGRTYELSPNGQTKPPFPGRTYELSPNGQNKHPFPGCAHHNHYPRTPNRAIRVRDFPNVSEPAGTSRPRDSGRSKPARTQQAQSGSNPAGTKRVEQPLGLQVRNQSAVSKVPCRISGLMLHGTTQKQGYNAKLPTAVSHSSQKASRHSASCAAQPRGLLRLLSASSRIPNPNPQSEPSIRILNPNPQSEPSIRTPRAEHPNPHPPPKKKQKPSEEGSCKSIKLGRTEKITGSTDRIKIGSKPNQRPNQRPDQDRIKDRINRSNQRPNQRPNHTGENLGQTETKIS